MRDKSAAVTDFFGQLDFGKIHLSEEQKVFYDGLNMAILDVIQSLPQTVQIDAMLLLTGHLKLPLIKDVDFFKGFYPPAWSLLYWVAAAFGNQGRLQGKAKHPYQLVHAIAMLLHLLDDHLIDGELPTTHLTLLVRSQMWMVLNQILDELTEGSADNSALVKNCIDAYYAGIESSKPIDSLDAYCEHFKLQMGFGYIAPVLLSTRMTADDHLVAMVRGAFGSFGCAWRLLDDLHDVAVDVQTNARSAVYVCLPEHIQRQWDDARAGLVYEAVVEEKIGERIVNRICEELRAASMLADASNIKGYARELRALAEPLRKRQFGFKGEY